MFRRNGASWSQQAYLKPPSVDVDDQFAHGIATSNGVVYVGARHEDGASTGLNGDPADNSASAAGAAYIFDAAEFPTVYCTAKVSSAGCSAAIATLNQGNTSEPISGAGDYAVTAASVQGVKPGLLFGGLSGATNVPFSGGTLCVEPPLLRGPILSSGGADPERLRRLVRDDRQRRQRVPDRTRRRTGQLGLVSVLVPRSEQRTGQPRDRT